MSKDRSLIDTLNPLFEEIDKLNENIPKYEKQYQDYLNELRKDAIKDDDISEENKIKNNSVKEEV